MTFEDKETLRHLHTTRYRAATENKRREAINCRINGTNIVNIRYFTQ